MRIQFGIFSIGLICASIIIMGLSIGVGSTSIPISTVYQIIGSHLLAFPAQADWSMSTDLIVWQIRAPRVVLAFLVGASLSLSGAVFQGLLRNPLADPYTLGVSSGAALGAVISIFFSISLPFLGTFSLPFFALTGSIISLLLVYGMSQFGNRMMIETLILSGIIVSSFIGAFISLLISLSGEELRQIIFWLMGSVGMGSWEHSGMLLPILCISFLVLIAKSRDLNILAFGEETAQYLGVDVGRSRKTLLLIASLLAASAVSVSGVIGFVGLVIPHFVRLITGPNHVVFLPASLFTGGIFLVTADTIARTIIAPAELPLGVITALTGAPLFAWLLVKQHKKQNR